MAELFESSEQFTVNQVHKIFQMKATKQTVINAEERGDIPKAHRIQRGTMTSRVWDTSQLPLIGERMGFLKKPDGPRVISVFSLKGGTGKSSITFQLARSFALHNVRCLVIGLDAQESITQTLIRTTSHQSADDVQGIFHILVDKVALFDAIMKTDLPTLSYIPETIELSILDHWLKQRVRKEYVIKERVVHPLIQSGQFDLVIFDCNPAWNEVVTGALGASDTLISPLGADINSLKAANIFIELLAEFQDSMKHQFCNLLIIPTMVENNKLSQTCLAKYRINYESLCTAGAIRRSVAVQEANALGRSLMEVRPNTQVFTDFVEVMKEINDSLMGEASQKQLAQTEELIVATNTETIEHPIQA